MSHFTRIKTKLRDPQNLRKTLIDLGYDVVEGPLTIRGFGGHTTQVDMAVHMEEGFDIGFRLSGQEYEIVADWWGVQVNQQKFVGELTQQYAYNTVVSEAQTIGFSIVEEERQRDGAIKVVLERWK